MFFFKFLCRAYRLGYLEHLHNFLTKRRRSAVIAFLGWFSPNIFAPSKKFPQNPILGIFQCKTYYNESKSHVNGATKLKLYTLKLYAQVRWASVKIFPLGGVRGAQGPLM